MQSRLIILSGPSGSGKTSLAYAALEHSAGNAKDPKTKDQKKLERIITYTTRRPREQEIDGVDYHFLDTPTFEQRIKEGYFAEWAQVYTRYYGTSRQSLLKVAQQESDHILVNDVQGAARIRQMELPHAFSIFVNAPSFEVISERLAQRGTDTPESFQERLKMYQEECAQAQLFDAIIINDNLQDTIDEFFSIISAH